MTAATIELADVFRVDGLAYRVDQAGYLSLDTLKVLAAIQRCRTVSLSGDVECCDACGYLRIAYNSCRRRHCPRYQSAAALD